MLVAGSGAVGFLCVDVISFALFDGVPSFFCESTSAFLFFVEDMLLFLKLLAVKMCSFTIGL